MLQTDDSTFGAVDPALALRPPIAASQSTAALRPQAPAAQTTAAIAPRAAPALIRPATPAADPLASYYAKVRQHESGGDDSISNGVAYGRYQFTPQTWLGVAIQHPELGLDKTNILDPAKQDQAMKALTADNAAALQKSGLEVTPENLFMLHFLGAGGGPKFLKALQADPSANAAALFPLETRYNPTIFHDPAGRPRSLGEVYGLMTKSFGGEAPAQPGNGISANLQFAEGPKTVASDAAVDAPSEPPPEIRAALGLSQPSGKTESIDMPPEIRKALGLPETSRYQTDMNGNLQIAPSQSAAPRSLRDLMKEQIRPDTPTTEQEALLKGEGAAAEQTGQTALGIGSGVGQFFSGLAEWDPTAATNAAAETSKYLKGVGSPAGQKVGGMLPFIAPVGEAAEAIGGGAKALSEGGSWVANALRGGVAGAKVGALSGASKATGEADTGKRLLEKAGETGEGTVAGFLLGGGGSLAKKGLDFASVPLGWAGRELGSLYKTATGVYEREAKKTVEELRTGISAETGKALTAKDIDKREAILDQRNETRRLAIQEADYQRADQAAQQIAKEFAARPTVTKDELGQRIHKAAVDDFNEVKAVRKRDSGFDKAVNSDGGRPSIDTDKLIGQISSVERRFSTDLSDLKTKLRTLPDVEGQPAIPRVSIERAREVAEIMGSRVEGATSQVGHALEELKKTLVDQIETTHPVMKTAREKYAALSRDADFYERSGAGKKAVLTDPYSGDNLVDSTKITGALLNNTEGGAEVLSRLVAKNPDMMNDIRGYFNHQLEETARGGVPTSKQIGDLLTRNRLAMNRIGMGEARAAGSGPVTVAESGGVKVRQVDSGDPAYQEYEIIDPSGKIVRMQAQRMGGEFHVLNVTTGPSIGEGFGFGFGEPNSIGPRTVRNAADALKKLHPEIKMVSGDRVSGARAAAGKEGAAAHAGVPLAVRESKPPLLKEFGGLKTRIEENEQALKTADEARTETQKSIEQLSKDREAATKARDHYFQVQSWLKEANVKEVPGQIKGIVDRLHDDHFIGDAQHKQFVTMARESKDSLEAATKAKHFVRYIILPLIASAGVGGEYLSHRIRP